MAAGIFVGWEEWWWISDAKQCISGYDMNLVILGLGRTWMNIPLTPVAFLCPSSPFTCLWLLYQLPSLSPQAWTRNSKALVKHVGNIFSFKKCPLVEEADTWHNKKWNILFQNHYPFSPPWSFILRYFGKQKVCGETRCWASVSLTAGI